MDNIEDLDAEEVLGKFYKGKLSPVDKTDEVGKVEKVLKRRKGSVLVEWLGYDDKFNFWIPEEELKGL